MREDYFLIVNSKVLPPVFAGVIEAKELLKSGAATNTSHAAKLAGISRSAYYKYKDYVFKYEDQKESYLNLVATLSDRAGVFSAMTAILFENGVNIVTVNQEAPINGTAAVSLAVLVDESNVTITNLLEKLRNVDGIISIKVV